MSVNKERVAALVAALRSGDYKQGKNRLKDEHGGYCCLGVACDISGLGRWAESEGLPYYLTREDKSGLMLTADVRDWYGFDSMSPSVSAPDDYQVDDLGQRVLLETLNDTGHTFERIADAIEAEWLTEVSA